MRIGLAKPRTYRPLLRADVLFTFFFEVTPELPERFERVGEFMINRTEATRLFVRPSLSPISSAEGTRFRIMYAIVHPS
jgi:hypothetical protein